MRYLAPFFMCERKERDLNGIWKRKCARCYEERFTPPAENLLINSNFSKKKKVVNRCGQDKYENDIYENTIDGWKLTYGRKQDEQNSSVTAFVQLEEDCLFIGGYYPYMCYFSQDAPNGDKYLGKKLTMSVLYVYGNEVRLFTHTYKMPDKMPPAGSDLKVSSGLANGLSFSFALDGSKNIMVLGFILVTAAVVMSYLVSLKKTIIRRLRTRMNLVTGNSTRKNRTIIVNLNALKNGLALCTAMRTCL